MELLRKLIAVFANAFPMPSWPDKAAVEEWLRKLAPSEADLIAAIAGQLRDTGHADFVLRDGSVVSITLDAQGKPTMSVQHVCMLAEALAADPDVPGNDAKAWRDWLEKFLEALPLILQLFGMFFKPNPNPSPEPGPIVVSPAPASE